MRLFSLINSWDVREFYAHIFRAIHWCLEVKVFCVKADKLCIATGQNTVNQELDQVKRTCGRAYISGTTNEAARYSDACTIGIFLLRSDLTHNHGVANFLPSVARDIFKANDTESVGALNMLFLGSL